MRLARLVLLVAALLLAASLARAQNEPRWALVIGNTDYEHISDLPGTVADAEAMAATLREVGFEVIEARNATRAGTYRAVRRLQETAAGAVVVVYYAGHGVQIGGRNYLLPVDLEPRSEADVEDNAVPIDDVLTLLAGAQAKLTVAFLDACRNNPLPASFRTTGKGLAHDARVPRGLMVVYSAGPGERALDEVPGEPSANGLFVHELLPELRRFNVPLHDAVEAAAMRIVEKAQSIGHDQNPGIYKQYYGDFVLRPGPPPPEPEPDPRALDREFWVSAERLGTPSAYRAYQRQFCPGGVFCALAEAALEQSQLAAVVPPRTAEPSSSVEPAVGVYGDADRRPRDVFRNCPECPEMVVVPAGEFLMGSPAGEAGRWNDESPQHRVTIAQPFAIGRYEVTFAEWDACVADGGCGGYRPPDEGWGRGRWPVIHVSWEDAQAYVRWLSGKTGHDYRLPSEAEWEYAARAGTTTPFWMGGTISPAQANYDGNYTYGWGGKGEYRERTVEVGSLPANPWGLHEVHGNVWEWVQDCWHDDYQDAPADGRAWEEDCSGSGRVVRGGSWYSTAGSVRSAFRGHFRPDYRDAQHAFRVSRTLTP